MIKPNSLYSKVVAFINSHNLGDTYTSDQFVDALYGATSHMKRRNGGQFYRVRTYQTYLKRIGMIQNVKRGIWQVNYHIPSWLTLSAVETIMGYKTGQYNYNTEKYVIADPAIKAKLVEKLKMYKMGIDKDGVQIDHEKEMKSRGFKVGATVKLIKTRSEIYDNSEYYLGEEKLVVGNTYTIHSLTDNSFNEGKHPVIYIKFHEHGYNHPYDCFEVFTHPKKKVNPKYNVGDLVEVITDQYSSIVRGDILPVLESYSYGIELKSEKSGNVLFFTFEMVRRAPVVELPKKKDHIAIVQQMGFKVGATVLFTNPKSEIYEKSEQFTKNLELGKTYTVSEMTDNMNLPGDIFLRIKGKNYVHPYDCFVVVKEEPKIKAAPAPKKNKDKSIAPYIALGAVWTHSGDNHKIEYKVIETGDNNVKLEWTGVKQPVTETHSYIQHHVNMGNLKLVDKEPKNFKVGDQFKSTSSKNIYTIASIIDGKVRVTWPTDLKGTDAYTIDEVDTYFSTGAWTKYTAPVKVEEPAKKMVECIDASWGTSISNGEIYTVIKEYTQLGDEFYDLKDKSGQEHVGFYKRRFKDVPPAKKFKVGDRAKIIGNTYKSSYLKAKVGQMVTISRFNMKNTDGIDCWIVLLGSDKLSINEKDLELVEQVLCIDNSAGVKDQLTVGKIYDILGGLLSGNIKVKNDNGTKTYYRGSRFIKVQG